MQSSAALSPQVRIGRGAQRAMRRKAFALALAAALALHAWLLTGLARETPPHVVAPSPIAARLTADLPEPSPDPVDPVEPVPPSDPSTPPKRATEPVAPKATAQAKAQAKADAAGVEKLVEVKEEGSSGRPPEPVPSERFAENASLCGAGGAYERAGAPAQAAGCSVEWRPTPALLALPLHGEGGLAYAFTINGQPGQATLSYEIDANRYTLTLERRAGSRDMPVWRSEGRTGPWGMEPERHRVIRSGRDRELLVFDRSRGASAATLLAGARAYPLPAGTQDRLSWWLQLAAMMATEPDRRLGLVLRVPVASAQGVHFWDFEVAARDGDRWLLRREAQRGAGRPALQWAVWLDGTRGFLPVDLRFSLDDEEQWALRLLE
ncbi:hypothetical protein [Roseateles sp.]|uniref:hypothetical protein n=1 Tax=Roseateles sp. TaxID=1971397 RepID=UPI0031E2AB90